MSVIRLLAIYEELHQVPPFNPDLDTDTPPMPVAHSEPPSKRPCGPNLAVRDEAAPEDLQFLEEQINEFNFATTGIRDARGLVILLRGADRAIYAGLSGHTWGGVAEIRFLWVNEAMRHTGIGSRLLRAAEHEARTRGCRKIVLSTHDFQAPGFYGKHGYIVAGAFSEYPRGHRSNFLEKALS
jgi:GNAT superfamily N-acetyltransferase